jgi:hypothetical protein
MLFLIHELFSSPVKITLVNQVWNIILVILFKLNKQVIFRISTDRLNAD